VLRSKTNARSPKRKEPRKNKAMFR